MLTGRLYAGADYLALKNAMRRACDQTGTLDEIAQHTRIGKASLHRCYSIAKAAADEQFCPLDVAADIDRLAGAPINLRALANMEGYEIVARAPSLATDTPAAHLAHIAREVGDVVASLAAAVADNNVTPREARALLKEAAEAETALLDLCATLRSIVMGEAAAADSEGAGDVL